MKNQLTVIDLYKNYENQPLLRGVSFEVNEGETICLLGRSGSGKSTILRIIAGIEKPEFGEVLWNNQSLSDLPVHKRQFGFMFQDYALFPHKNVFENVAFGLRMQNLSPEVIKQKVNQVLEKVKMSHFSKRSVTDLSGGEQQRVALARALAPEPRLLMLDEPLGSLDRTLREQLVEELRLILQESQIPAIYVTHDQEEAFTLGDRLLLLNGGKIVQNGTPEEVYLHPQNAWVAEFIGLSNFIEGTIESLNPTIIKTDLGKIQIDTTIPEKSNIGETVKLLIRSDALNLGISDVNNFKGILQDEVFLGNYWKIKLMIENNLFGFLLTEPFAKDNNIEIWIDPKKISILQS